MSQPLIDETNNRYGALTVKSLTKDKNGRTAWLCQCDCGNTKIVRGPDLRKGKIKYCSKACPEKKTNNVLAEDFTGKKIGMLKVLYRQPYNSSSNKPIWHCLCDCGKECDKISPSLKKEDASCGCDVSYKISSKASIDLTGQRFGKLIVLGKSKKEYSLLWKCQCDCGNICYKSREYLINNLDAGNCGCIKQSKGAYLVEQFLIKNNFIYKKEYHFNDLQSDNSKYLRFDFAIFKNKKLFCLIEYNGGQHYKPVEMWGGQKGFERQQKHDLMKKEYCEKNNIPLYTIKYNDNISTKLAEIAKDYDTFWD